MLKTATFWSFALFSLSAMSQPAATDDPAIIEKRVAFFQQNFSKFVPVHFQSNTNSEAVIQYLHVKDNTFVYDGTNYCGFQFAVPEWIDGDFEWMYILAKTEASKNFSTHTLSWYIIPKTGRSGGFEYFKKSGFSDDVFLKSLFPYTNILTTQDLDKDRLKPGQTYAIWFGFMEPNMPDIAFAMTIDSQRGAKECGALPLR